MKKTIAYTLIIAAASGLCGTTLRAQLLNARFIGSIYTFEKFDTVNVSKKYVRGFQSALVDFSYADFSIHTHFQVSGMLQRKLDEIPDYRFYYLYGQWKNLFDVASISVGRIPYFAGVGNGTIDGGLVTVRPAGNLFRLTVYGGQTTPLEFELKDWKKLKNNFTLGGQVIVNALPNTRLGISYTNRQRERAGYFATREDSLFNPVLMFIEPRNVREQFVSGDVSYTFGSSRIYGRYDYDLNFKQTQRGQLGIRLSVTDELSVTGDFIHRAPRLPFGSFFSVFDLKTVDEYELGADYFILPDVRGFLRGAYVKYSGEKGFRYAAGVVHKYVGLTYRGSDGYAGALDNASIQITYPLCDNLLIPSVGFAYMTYRFDRSAPRVEGFAGTLGATVRPMDQLSFDVQGQWLRNKIVQNDLRLFARFNYWLTQTF